MKDWETTVSVQSKLNYINPIIFKTFRGPAKHTPRQAFAKTLPVLKLVKPRRGGSLLSKPWLGMAACLCRTPHLASWWSNCTLAQLYMPRGGPVYSCLGGRCYTFVCICILVPVSIALHVALARHTCTGRTCAEQGQCSAAGRLPPRTEGIVCEILLLHHHVQGESGHGNLSWRMYTSRL